jgi:RNA polymerase sigma-54 factor
MAFELRQQVKLTQQLVMTPQLQQAIKLLQLSRLELLDTIRQELEENPALEEVQEISGEERALGEEPEPVQPEAPEKEVTIEERLTEDVDWSNYIDEYNTPGKVNFEGEAKESPQYEAFIAPKESLSDHLLWQLLMTSPSPEEEQIASLIIGNLTRNGYVDLTLPEIAEISGATEETVASVLGLLQTFDPAGVCALSLVESLMIQADRLEIDDPLVTDILQHHFHHLENKNYKAIARGLKREIEEIVAAVEVIKGLDPCPGRRFSEDPPQYITPDIHVYKIDGEFVILLNDDGMPRLRLSAYYKEAVGSDAKMTTGAKQYIQEKIRSASWLIKSIQQRQKTLYRVMESILKFQRDFFEKGIEHLKPLVLRDVAQDIDMHESTISRVTTNKYAYTPQGIFELKYFFNSSISRSDGEAMASASVMQRIRQIIENEDPKAPLSDDKISEMLKASNINIARRTVAKYREMMRLLPSSKRRQY